MKYWTPTSKMVLSISFYFLMLCLSTSAVAQAPTVTVRFANPDYNCLTAQYCVDVEFLADSADVEVFGMNVRFFYDDSVLELDGFTDFQGGYGPVSPNPPTIFTSPTGPVLFNFSGSADFVNGAIQLLDSDTTPLILDTVIWTKIFQVCFTIDDPAPDVESFCPSLVWDLEQNPANGGYLVGDDGVVITIIDPNGMMESVPALENVDQFNWMYIGSGTPPFGIPFDEVCIPLGCLPAIACPADITIQCDESTDPANTGLATATDCEGNVVITFSDVIAAGTCPQEYTITRTWFAANDCEADTCVQIIQVSDTIPPTIICPPNITIDCSETPVFDTVVVFDACDSLVTVTFTDTITGSIRLCIAQRAYTRTWTATDDCGNSATCSATITSIDSVGPDIICPADITIDCTSDTGPGVTGTASATDNCSLISPLTFSDVTIAGDCPQEYSISRTWTATDACGNTSTCLQLITVQDTVPPTFNPACQLVFQFFTSDGSTCPAESDISLVVGQIVGESDNWTVGSNTIPSLNGCLFDNCSNPDSLTARVDSIAITGDSCDRTITVFFTILDQCGNESVLQFICVVIIHDDTPPAITCPVDVTIDCEESTDPANTGIATATDECQVFVTITSTDVSTPGQCLQELTILRTWTATDTCGNSSTCVQTITVQDTTAPLIICPPDTMVDCTVLLDTIDFGVATVTDVCDTLVDVTFVTDTIDGNCPQEYTISRTWTAVDDCGNTSSCVQLITVQDTTPPTFDTLCNRVFDFYTSLGSTCPLESVPSIFINILSGIPIGESEEWTVGNNVITSLDGCLSDNCSNPDSLIALPVSGQVSGDSCNATYTVSFVIYDQCGNPSVDELVYIINIHDDVPPEVTCPVDVTIECSESTSPDNTGLPTATDDCQSEVTFTSVDSILPGICPNEFIIVRTWTADDSCGNFSTCIQSITVQDNTAPVISCPADITIECDASSSPDSTGLATATDACDPTPELTSSDVTIGDQPCPQEYIIIRTWTATDTCGNSSTCVQVISVEDNTAPLLTCPDDVTIECTDSTLPDSTGFATATDNCDSIPLVVFLDITASSQTCPQEYTITRTWTATDACGNVGTCIQIITIDDSTPPSIDCPDDVTIECTESTSAEVNGVASATDNCDPFPLITSDDVTIAGECPQEYIINRTWTATDACGNSSTCLQVISVEDNTPPVISCPGDLILECSDTIPSSLATATDNCGDSLTYGFTDIICDNPIQGFTDIYDFSNWTVIIPPEGGSVTPMGDSEVQLVSPDGPSCSGASALFSIVVPSTGQIVFDWNYTTSDVDGPNFDPFGYNLNGTFFQLTDDNGADSQSGTVSVNVTAGDVFAFEQNSQDCILGSGATTVIEFFACIELDENTCNQLVIRTHTAEDECGNVASCVQTIFIEDTTPPVISCPLDVTIDCIESTFPINTGFATATDECQAEITVDFDDVRIPGECGTEFTLIRTWTADDSCGNVSTCVQVINVIDTIAPLINCPADTLVDCSAITDTTTFGIATATDGCDRLLDITFVSDTIAGDCPQEFTITRTWTAVDDCFNSSSCVQTISVQDTTPPTWNPDCQMVFDFFTSNGSACPADANISLVVGQIVTEMETWTVDGNTIPSLNGCLLDNCSNPDSLTARVDSILVTGDSCVRMITVYFTILDQCGNESVDPFVCMVNIHDDVSPAITCPGDVTIECDASTSPDSIGFATATDDCQANVIITPTDSIIPGTCPNEFVIVRTWTADDGCGNDSICVQTITVEDNTAPVITCPANLTIECDDSTSPDSTGFATATDNCDASPTIISDDITISSKGCQQEYLIIRTWTATDTCGNSTVCTQTIFVQDTTGPVITCPVDVTIECTASTLPDSTGFATATDNCDPEPVVGFLDVTVASQVCPQEYTITRTWTTFDDCGNSTSCIQTITVDDSTPPIIACPGDVTIECTESTSAEVNGVASATDNCDPLPLLTSDDVTIAGDCPQEYTITRTWTATDACGNSSTCIQTITVDDSTPPVISCPVDLTIECSDTIPSGLATATDNCGDSIALSFTDIICDNPISGFNGVYDFANWTVIIPPEGGSVTPVGNTEVMLVGPDGVSCSGASTLFSIVVPASGQLVFDWNYITSDVDGPNFDPFGYNINGTFFQLTDDNGPDAQSGTVSILVTAGDVFAFEQSSNDCVLGSGATTVVEFYACIDQAEEVCTQLVIRTHSAIDECGNESICVQTIFIDDTTAPLITCPADITIECDESTLADSTGLATATDNCDVTPDITMSDVTIASQTCPQEYTIIRTWTATDACGNSTTCAQTILVDDSTPPVITCPTDLTIECTESTLPDSTGFATATDNCDPVPTVDFLDLTVASTICPQEYTITRTWTATDACGNSSTCIQTISIDDSTPPVISCPDTLRIECTESTSPDVTGQASATDNCDPAPLVTFDDVTIAGECPQEYVILRTWTATDACGNSSTCVQLIGVEDNTPPVITCPDDITIECSDTIPTDLATATDNCGDSITLGFTDILCDNPISGFTDVYDFTNWTITLPPQGGSVTPMGDSEVMLVSPDGLSSCNGASVLFSIVIPSTGQLVFDWNYLSSDVDGPAFDPFGYNLNGTFFQLTDNNGPDAQSGTTTVSVTAGDVFAFQQNSSDCIFGEGATTVIEFFACVDQMEEACTQLIIRTHTAADECGNESSCIQTIYIIDTIAPVITCPADLTIECDASTSPDSTGFATATDVCDLSPDITFSDQIFGSKGCDQEYFITRTWIATDACGNSSTCIQSIIVEDNTPPVLTCPDDITIECTEIPSTDLTGFATATDNCDTIPLIISSDVTIEGGCPQEYTITRTWTAIDECGNSSTCVQTITIDDSTPPDLTCPPDVTLECTENTTTEFNGFATATDNCDPFPIVTSADVTVAGSCPQEYTINRTWTATDACGNTSTCLQVLEIEDTTPPTITCPPNLTFQCANQVPAPNIAGVTASDSCGTVTITFVNDAIINQTCVNRFTLNRTYQAADECGNTATCVQVITVFDNTPPVITCPAGVTVSCASQVPAANPASVIASDNCGGTTTVMFVNDVISNQTCVNRFTVTRTYRATDACGNSATCTQIIIVNDITPPVITCPANLTVQCASQVPAPAPLTVVATDNCGGTVTVTHAGDVISNMTCVNRFVVTRTYLATDACGNTATCTQVITVFDNTAPVITCPPNVTVQCSAQVPAPNVNLVIASDNCGGTTTVTHVGDVITNQTCINRFILTRTYRATDACGNSATCTQVITVFDNTPPVITFTDPLLEGVPNGGTVEIQCFGQDPEWDLPTFDETSVSATDNCAGPVSVSFTQVLLDEGNCAQDGFIFQYRLTWTATDACGNSSTAFVFLELIDTIPPVIHGIPEDVTVNCDELPALPDTVFATDECMCACVILFEESDPAPGCQDGQVIVRSWTATDDCGNVTIETQNITLIDNEGPELQLMVPELQGVTDGTILEYTCNEGGIPDFFDVLDAESVFSPVSCGTAGIISFNENIIHSNNCKFWGYIEQRTYTWEGIDQCGNTSSLEIVVRLIDTDEPVLFGVPDTTCIGDPALLEVDATDNCGHPFIRYWDVAIPNPCGDGTAMRRTYEAYDDCGNMSRDTAILIPNDLTPPTIEFVNPILADLEPGEVLIIDCELNGGQFTSFTEDDVRVVDGCTAGSTVTYVETSIPTGDCSITGYYAIVKLVWTATDACGNTGERTLTALVVDQTPPVLVDFETIITIGCNDTLPEIQATDNCSSVNLVVTDSIIQGNCPYEYDVHRLITATDECGNTITKKQVIHVGDGTGPVIEGVEEEVCDDLSIPEVTAFDECAGEFVEVTMKEDTLDVPCRDGLVIERTWTAVDICGHVTTIHQTIVVNDHTPPEILVPSQSIIRFFMDNSFNLVFLSQENIINKLNALDENSVFILDECDQEIIPVFTVDITYSEDCEEDGYFERRVYTWFATDICGNSAVLTFTVHIMDDVPPVLNGVPEDTMIICSPLPPPAIVTATDPAQPVTIVYKQTIEQGDGPGQFVVFRRWIATDACGNVTEALQSIIWIPDTGLECEILLPELVECNTHGVVIGSSQTGGLGPFTYMWEVVGEKCFIQSGQGTTEILIYIGFSEVEISLTITDAFGCQTVCTATLDCLLSFDDAFVEIPVILNPATDPEGPVEAVKPTSNDYLKDYNLWPNPAKGTVNLSFKSLIEEEVEFSIINFLGQVIMVDEMDAIKGYNSKKIDISRIPEGSYLLQLKTEKEMHTKVIVILRND